LNAFQQFGWFNWFGDGYFAKARAFTVAEELLVTSRN